MSKFPVFLLTGSALLLLLSGCEDENVLYETNSQTSQNSSVQVQPQAAPPMMQGDAMQDAAKAGALRPPADRPMLDPDQVDTVEKSYHQVAFYVPQEWKDVPPSSQMRTAEFVMTSDAGSDSLMTVFYFGPNGGGTAASNLTRWAGQITSPTNADPEIYTYAKNDLVIYEILAKGTLVPTGMGTGPNTPQPDQFLYGVIIEGGPEGALYLKSTGPEAELAALEPALYHLTDSIKVAGSDKGEMIPTEPGAAY